MRLTMAAVLAAMCVQGAAQARPDADARNRTVQRGPVPEWALPSEPLPVPQDATGMVFMRRQDVVVHLGARGTAQHSGFQARILHPNALEMGNITVSWDPAAGAPTVHAIRVHRDGQIIDVLAGTAFEVLRREENLEAAQLNGTLTAVLRVPDLRVGDDLEVAVTTLQKDPTLGLDDAGLLLLAASPPPGRYRLALNWDEGHQPHVRMTPDMTAAARQGQRAVEFRFDNPAMLAPPKDAPQRFQWQRIVEYSDFADWATISRRFAPIFARAARLSAGSPLKAEAARIAAVHATPLDRAGAALKLVQQDVRYVYVGLDGGNLTPVSAEETWQRRYGDCKGKAALLLALLGELGVDAEVVLANNSGLDDGLAERLPSPKAFDHVLVRARIDGAVYYLDGTLPPVAVPATEPAYPYRAILPLTGQGSALEPLPWRPATRPDQITLYDIDARAGFDVPARIRMTTIIRGLPGLQQQAQLSAVSPGDLLAQMRQQLVGGALQTVEEAQWRYDRKARASVMTITGTRAVTWDRDGGAARSLALPGGGFSPPEQRVRPADQNQDAPFRNTPAFECSVTTVRVPSATQSAHWSFTPGYDARFFGRNYYRAIEMRGGTIRMVRGFRVERDEIDVALARRDNARLTAFDNSMAWVFYNPDSLGPRPLAHRPVPATDEIDWTADDVPCLAGPGASPAG